MMCRCNSVLCCAVLCWGTGGGGNGELGSPVLVLSRSLQRCAVAQPEQVDEVDQYNDPTTLRNLI